MSIPMNMSTPIPMAATPIPMPTGIPIHTVMSTSTVMCLTMQPMTTRGFTAAMTMIIPGMRRSRILIPMIDPGKSI